MDMTNQEYSRYVEQKAKPSPIWKNLTWAFCTGGLICTGGQALLNLYRGCGLSEGDAGTAVSVTIIFLAALFTGLGWFDRLAKHAGAGTLVPITGFANAVVAPALEFRSEGLVMGVGARMFAIAGPVLAYGISAAVLYGLVLCLFFPG
ncbi:MULTISPECIES: stage V sporulation protein AC [unclassified Flavonifractor]|uniref:stage V sporulation protein AC n=1 Tax=unclassified Flavonifractor TaxID=2629267 RepID=UPI000B38E09A|nr:MULTISPECIES: stage V sporulation protein AC [unclassified Flavonifractor]OUQ82080.1 stage V sporulation protein AC [Flavonifractor sp. An10]HJB69517.1 stage V sporulation protein AC [Candidatus Flavonifractor avistercoris]